MNGTAKQSPVKVHKYTLVNNANLDQQFVVVREGRDAYVDDAGIEVPEIPEVLVKQFEYCSKRQMRAIRKGRLLKMKHKVGMLFAQREDGTHYPVSLKKHEPEFKTVSRPSSKLFLGYAIPGTPIEDQKKAMGLYRMSLRPVGVAAILEKKEA